MTATLPDRGDGSRRRRRQEAIRRRRTQRAVAAVGLGAALLIGYVVLRHNSPGYSRPTFATSTTLASAALDVPSGPPPGLVAVVDGGGQLRSVTLLAVAPSGRGGDLVHVPVGTLVDSASGVAPLRALMSTGGLAAVRDGLATLLGVDLLAVAVPADRVPVGMSASGSADLAGIAADQPVWDRWLAAIRAGSESEPSPAVAGELGNELLALSSGEVDHHLLPVESVGEGVERVRVADLDGLVARVFPGRAGPGP